MSDFYRLTAGTTLKSLVERPPMANAGEGAVEPAFDEEQMANFAWMASILPDTKVKFVNGNPFLMASKEDVQKLYDANPKLGQIETYDPSGKWMYFENKDGVAVGTAGHGKQGNWFEQFVRDNAETIVKLGSAAVLAGGVAVAAGAGGAAGGAAGGGGGLGGGTAVGSLAFPEGAAGVGGALGGGGGVAGSYAGATGLAPFTANAGLGAAGAAGGSILPAAGLSLADKMLYGSLGLTGLSTVAGMLDSGDKSTSATTSTLPTGLDYNMPGTDVPVKQKTFEDFIDDWYGLNDTKSVQQRGAEDQQALQGHQKTLLDTLGRLDTKRLADTKAAVSPYQQQLTDQLAASQGGTGLYKPMGLSFGGVPMASFVPKQNMAQASNQLDLGRENANINTGMVDMGYKSGTDLAGREFGFQSENLPNKAANTYSQQLQDIMFKLNPTGQTSTTTGTIPGTPWYTTALQGATTGVNLWDKIQNPRQAGALDLLKLLQAKGV